MSLWDIYRAKKNGIATEALFGAALGMKLDDNYELVTEKTPYIKRPSGGVLPLVGTKATDKIIGGSVAWNQQLGDLSASDYDTNAADVVYDNGKATIVATLATATGIYLKSAKRFGIKGHKYIITATLNAKQTGSFQIGFGALNWVTPVSKANEDVVISTIQTPTTDKGAIVCYRMNSQVGDEYNLSNYNVFDLTQMFGTSIADYIYSLEQGNSGAGTAYFRKLFAKESYSLNEGEMMSVNAIARKTYSRNGSVIGNYVLDDIVLCGIPKLDANNQLYYDGDIYESVGEVTRKYALLDLGTLAWTKNSESGHEYFYSTNPISGIKAPGSSADIVSNIKCATLVNNSFSNAYAHSQDKIIGVSASGRIGIYDSSSVSLSNVQFQSAMSGIYIIYELATPITEQASAYENPQTVIPNGIEEYVDGLYASGDRDVEIPVGHITEYKARS